MRSGTAVTGGGVGCAREAVAAEGRRGAGLSLGSWPRCGDRGEHRGTAGLPPLPSAAGRCHCGRCGAQ